MGSMLKFDSDRRELVRERRDARIERKQQRRQARERKHSHVAAAMPIRAVGDAADRATGAAGGGRPDRRRGTRAPRAAQHRVVTVRP